MQIDRISDLPPAKHNVGDTVLINGMEEMIITVQPRRDLNPGEAQLPWKLRMTATADDSHYIYTICSFANPRYMTELQLETIRSLQGSSSHGQTDFNS